MRLRSRHSGTTAAVIGLALAATAILGCGGSAEKLPPDQSAALANYQAKANQICAQAARRSKSLQVELTDYKPAGQATVDLSTIIGDPAYRRDLRTNTARIRRLQSRTLNALTDLKAPSGVRVVVVHWLYHYGKARVQTPPFQGYKPAAEMERRSSATKADLYAVLLGLDSCVMEPAYKAPAPDRLIPVLFTLPNATGQSIPRPARGRITKVLDGRIVELASSERVLLAQFAAPQGNCEAPARRALESAFGHRGEVGLQLAGNPREKHAAYLFNGATSVNLELAAQGQALIDPDAKEKIGAYASFLTAASQIAQATRQGLWQVCAEDALSSTELP
jgi:hypothetical protein